MLRGEQRATRLISIFQYAAADAGASVGADADPTEKAAGKAADADKDGNDLDAVAGNAEDDIGDLIATIREKELLYGDQSLLAVYGPMVASICASPKRYRVSCARGRLAPAGCFLPAGDLIPYGVGRGFGELRVKG
jgi:hypothetical protein